MSERHLASKRCDTCGGTGWRRQGTRDTARRVRERVERWICETDLRTNAAIAMAWIAFAVSPAGTTYLVLSLVWPR